MALLKTTYVSGNLFATGSNEYISASEFRGPLTGTASWATSASEAVHAISASAIDPGTDLQVKSLLVSGNAQVNGDLKVLGDLTYVGVQDLRVKDHLIELNVDASGSASAAADGGGIVIRNSQPAGDIELIYSASDDKLHVNKVIAGTIDSASEAVHAQNADNAATASVADKVAFKLSFGAGLSSSAADYDGHEAVSISVDTASIAAVKVNSASRADSAAEADKVAESLTLKYTAEDGTAAADVVFDGESAKTFSVDLSGLESKTHASASVANLQDQINAISGESGSGTIAERIQEAINALDADADANASGTAVSGGVFVLSGVAFNEADGKLTSGSATSVEVEKAGEAAKAKAELLGAAGDATGSMTLYGIKNYVDAKTGDGVAALSESVATDFSASNAARVALSESVSQSIADVASNALNLVESSSYIAVSAKANNKQTISAKTANVASASATGTDGLAIASDVKDYVDAQVGGKDVAAVGDEYVALNAANNAVTASTTIKAIADATAAKQGLVDAYDAKQHVSASVAALSSSIASANSASDARLAALETASGSAIDRLNTLEAATSSYALSASVATEQLAQNNRLDALETASGSAITRLDALETASATHVTNDTFNNYTSSVSTSMSASDARIEALEESEASASALYVAKAGDTMSGDLTMGSDAGIVMGRMRVIWNAEDQAIEFVPMSA